MRLRPEQASVTLTKLMESEGCPAGSILRYQLKEAVDSEFMVSIAKPKAGSR